MLSRTTSSVASSTRVCVGASPLAIATTIPAATRPVRELRGFQRVHLTAGECRTVTFRLSTEQLAYVDVDYRRIVEPGTVRLFVGRSSVDASSHADIALVGPVVDLVERREYLTASTVD